jgi:very-short-patch-repair endonuclease
MFEHTPHPASAISRARRFRQTMGVAEQVLWRELRKLKLPIRRQAPIGSFVADFACHRRKLVIEIDGGIHERIPEVAARDQARTEWLESRGYRVARFTNNQVVNDVAAVVEAIQKLLALPLDGGGLGGGVSAELTAGLVMAPAPNDALRPNALHSPPSPTLPPSRRKGE